MKRLFFLIFFLSSTFYINAQDSLKLASFNIQIFGKSKSAKPEIMDTLASIISKYDFIAIQEIKNKSGIVVPRLLKTLTLAGHGNYKALLSERTGKQIDDGSSQEQYLYVYDSTKIIAHDSLTIKYSFLNSIDSILLKPNVYNDKYDSFQREPFIAYFSTIDSSFKFSILNIHTRPESAYEEIDALLNIGVEMNNFYRFITSSCDSTISESQNFLKNIIMLGDYNADCNYVSDSELDTLKNKYPTLQWLIPEDTETNLAKSTKCTYDRIVVTKDMMEHLTNNFGVDRSFTSKKVSDHYPIWYKFKY